MGIEEHPLLKNKFEWKMNLGLDRIKRVLSFLKEPQNSFSAILVGGTNGKGTVAKALSEILLRAGKKTGLFISPHLERITERISIDGREITEGELGKSLDEILKAKETCGVELTYFEVLTACAFLIFKRRKIDYGVLEVGMGGRLDATNIAEPLLSIIVSIGYDHEEYLGKGLKNIAIEKAGIVRENGKVIAGENRKPLISAIMEKRPATLYIYGKHFSIKKQDRIAFYRGFNSFKFSIPEFYPFILLRDFGIAIFASELLGIHVNQEMCEDIISNMKWHGRCEVFPTSPPIIMDGGHNLEAVKNLVKFIKKELKIKKVVSLLGFMKDKKPENLLPFFENISTALFLTELPSERSWNPEDYSYWTERIYRDPVEGFEDAWRTAMTSNLPLLIGGSFYLVGYIRKKGVIKKN